MKEIEFEVILFRLVVMGFNYTQTAKTLGMSYKGLSLKIKQIKKLMPDKYEEAFLKSCTEKFRPEIEDHIWKGMPTNDERVKYLDTRF